MDTDYQEQNSPTVQELLAQVRELEQKVARLQRERSVYAAKARLLSEELEKYRSRELRQDNTVETLLERQREMHVMLNRSHIMLAKAQNATAMLSLEFGELARALPETVSAQAEADPEQAQTVQYEIDDRIRRINDLFRMTGELSQEIAETLEGTEKAMKGAGATTVQSPPQQPSIQDEKPAAVPSPAAGPASPQETAASQQAPAAPPQEEEYAETVAAVVVEEEPAPKQTTGDAAAAQDTDVREAVFSEVTEQESPSPRETVSASGGDHEQSFSNPPRTAVPPPKDIFVSPTPTPRRKLSTGAISGAGPSRTRAEKPLPEGTDNRDGSEAAEAREALDRLVREQEERDAQAGGTPKKRGFWSRLIGG